LFKFSITIVALAALFIGVLWIFDAAELITKPTFSTQTISLVSFTTIAIYFYLSKPKLKSYFLQIYLASMVVKLLAYCTYVFIVIIKDKSNAFANVIVFLIVYVVFTGLEIAFLHRKITGAPDT
jgi:hypothetical protein